MKKILYIILLISNLSKAQDHHFSQFYMSPLTLNPAMAGTHNHDMVLRLQTRNQWAGVLGKAAYNTYSASADSRFRINQGNDYLGVGITCLANHAGTSGFQRNNAGLSIAYGKMLAQKKSKFHYLIVGFESSYDNYRLNPDQLRFLQQFNQSDIFDPSLPAPILQQQFRNFGFMNFNAGLLWRTIMPKYYAFHIGLSVHHVNQPNVSFAQSNKLHPRFTINFGGQYSLGDKRWAVVPNVIAIKQAKSFELNTGLSLRRVLQFENSYSPPKSFQFGAWLRFNNKLENKILADAIVFFTRFDYDKYTFGFSYDSNISSLRLANAFNAAYEFSIHYVIDGAFPKRLICPKHDGTQDVFYKIY